jgi:hypothetical protein
VRDVVLEQVAHARHVVLVGAIHQVDVGDHPPADLVGGPRGGLHDGDEDAEDEHRDEHGGHGGEGRHRVALQGAKRLAQEEPELHSSRIRIANSPVVSRAV